MAISASLMRNLINDGQVIISPRDWSCLVGNQYNLHTGTSLKEHENDYGFNDAIDTANPPATTSQELTKHGFYIEPNRMYIMKLKENVQCEKYSIDIRPHDSVAQYGLTFISVEISGGDITVTMTTSHAMSLYPDQIIAALTLEEGDTGNGAIPIGGIIAWSGTEIPYGYCLCNGSHGSPNLVGRFIRGSTTNRRVDMKVVTDLGSDVYDLVYIMRYK